MSRVLVCDDEPQILRALRVILRDAGYEVVTAATAEEALDAVAVRPPDAAILDLILPDGDGIEVTRSIREWSEMPILVLSAVGDEAEKVRALDAGADDYVTKPFGPPELIARLNAAMRRVEPRRRGGGGRGRRPAGGLRATPGPGRAARTCTSPRSSSTCSACSPATAAGCSPTARCSPRSGARPTSTTPRCCGCTSPTCAKKIGVRPHHHRSGRGLPLRLLTNLYAPRRSLMRP